MQNGTKLGVSTEFQQLEGGSTWPAGIEAAEVHPGVWRHPVHESADG